MIERTKADPEIVRVFYAPGGRFVDRRTATRR